MTQSPLKLFDAFGIELELMIVDADTLNVLPICDQLLQAAAGELTGEVEFGPISWSNELALHVLEFKVTQPLADLTTAAALFQENILRASKLLENFHARLMPTAMHPWMNPSTEMVLWPHDYSPVYAAFDRIFNCSGHGWANLQSAHWNLPFRGDAEFARLHSAIRVILPLLPALTASSPIYDSIPHGQLDCRLDVYRQNSRRIPSIAGLIVPEAVFSFAEYDREIYQPMYADIASLDPDGILQHVWLNARGAIARFDRGAIEIRVLDVQECPRLDIALGSFIAVVLQALVEGRWSSMNQQSQLTTESLAAVLQDTTRVGLYANVPMNLANLLGYPGARTVGELWGLLLEELSTQPLLQQSATEDVARVLEQGNLAERILRALAADYSRGSLTRVYRRLADCLLEGAFFDPQAC